jgi:SAM-dependent methyltransferase
MTADYYTREDCRLCQSDALHKVFALTPTPPANAFISEKELDQTQDCYPLDIYQCRDCAHVQLPTVVAPEVLFRDYVYVSGTSPVFVQHFADYAKQIISNYDVIPDQLVVDVGSNDGTLLRCFKQHGVSVLGIDPAVDIARSATEQGIETWPDFFSESLVDKVIEQKGQAKVICANNVFAHTDKIVEFVRAVKRLLAEDGVFVFEVSYLVDVYEKTLFDMTYHEHVAYHSVMPLQALFEREGLTFVDTQRVNTHGGSLRGIVQHQGGPYQRQDRADALIAKEKELGLDQVATLESYGEQIQAVGTELKQLLLRLKKEGHTIIGYGAPAKATTLMYQFGIDSSLIDFIVDDSPLKQNLYTPGLHIPVLPSSEIATHKPNYILILAWNFAEAIINKNKHLYDAGCRFITPLPKVEIR